jgi:hypothetical protein
MQIKVMGVQVCLKNPESSVAWSTSALALLRHSDVDDNGHAVDADQCTLGDGTALHGVLVAEGIVRISPHTQAQNQTDIPRNTAEDGERGTASADGDVQVRDVDPKQREDHALGDRVDRARVLDVLAALRGARRGASGTSGDGGGNGGESEEGGEELHSRGERCWLGEEGRRM